MPSPQTELHFPHLPHGDKPQSCILGHLDVALYVFMKAPVLPIFMEMKRAGFPDRLLISL
jgi:hypothetical protein